MFDIGDCLKIDMRIFENALKHNGDGFNMNVVVFDKLTEISDTPYVIAVITKVAANRKYIREILVNGQFINADMLVSSHRYFLFSPLDIGRNVIKIIGKNETIHHDPSAVTAYIDEIVAAKEKVDSLRREADEVIRRQGEAQRALRELMNTPRNTL